MLNPAYQALLRIQSKISAIRTLEEIKVLMQEEASNPKVRVLPATIWTLELKTLDQTALSIKELGFCPILTEILSNVVSERLSIPSGGITECCV